GPPAGGGNSRPAATTATAAPDRLYHATLPQTLLSLPLQSGPAGPLGQLPARRPGRDLEAGVVGGHRRAPFCPEPHLAAQSPWKSDGRSDLCCSVFLGGELHGVWMPSSAMRRYSDDNPMPSRRAASFLSGVCRRI